MKSHAQQGNFNELNFLQNGNVRIKYAPDQVSRAFLSHQKRATNTGRKIQEEKTSSTKLCHQPKACQEAFPAILALGPSTQLCQGSYMPACSTLYSTHPTVAAPILLSPPCTTLLTLTLDLPHLPLLQSCSSLPVKAPEPDLWHPTCPSEALQISLQ